MDIIPALVLFLGLPLAMLFVFNSNGGIMFLSACAGLVLLNSLDPVVVTTAGAVVPGEGEAYVRLAVVIMSIVFAGLVFRGTTKGSALLLNCLVVVILAVVLWLTLPAVTGVSWLLEGANIDLWIRVNDYRTLIIASGFALSLVAVLLARKRSSHDKGGKGKH
jgi:hypothetical protein